MVILLLEAEVATVTLQIILDQLEEITLLQETLLQEELILLQAEALQEVLLLQVEALQEEAILLQVEVLQEVSLLQEVLQEVVLQVEDSKIQIDKFF